MDATREPGSLPMFRRDGHFAEMVIAELAGAFEAPIYGMLEVAAAVDAHDWGKLPKPAIRLYGQPETEANPTLLWDGEWEITYVTFRDMGAAFMVALLGIYVLVVGQFGSFKLPLVILTPIPLTLIGIMIGHALFGAPFTATSMIGFIALAGIIVRNSILLVDFIRRGRAPGRPLRDVLLEAGAVRFKPILLTALAAMIGAAVILTDPIFQGLAISLLFGLASSTLLTVRDDGRLRHPHLPARQRGRQVHVRKIPLEAQARAAVHMLGRSSQARRRRSRLPAPRSFERIERGDFPEWELGLQLFDDAFAESYLFDILDPTKIVPEEVVPLRMVGRMVRDRWPSNFFAEAEQVAGMVQTAADRLQGLDGLALNVGRGAAEQSLAGADAANWDHVVAVNLRGPMFCCRAALSLLPAGAAIVFISSIAGLGAGSRMAAYDASKTGLHGLMRHVAFEGAKSGIRGTVSTATQTVRFISCSMR